jgi:hypothetical protein
MERLAVLLNQALERLKQSQLVPTVPERLALAGAQQLEVALDTAALARSSVDSAALKRQGHSVATGLIGDLRN